MVVMYMKRWERLGDFGITYSINKYKIILKGNRKKSNFFSGPTTKQKGTFFNYFFLFVAVEKLNILC